MKNLESLVINPFIAFIIIIKDLLEIAREGVTKMENGILIQMSDVDWLNIVLDIIIMLFIFFILRGMKKFSRAVIDNTHAQAILNRKLLEMPDADKIQKKYKEDFKAITNYRPYGEKELEGLYIFDPKNPHRDNMFKD